jgi:hypothetical protein
MNTLETLMALFETYAVQISRSGDGYLAQEARRLLQSALSEVLAERDRKSEVIQKLWAERDQLRAEAERLKAQEPVAWRTFNGEGQYDIRNYEDNEDYRDKYIQRNPKYAHWVEPLYLASGAAHTDHPMRHYDRTYPACNGAAPTEPRLQWCETCGEGVTDFCRGKGIACPYGFKKLPQKETDRG